VLNPHSGEDIIVLDTSVWDVFSAWKTCVAENGPFYEDEATGESRRAVLEDKLRETPTGPRQWLVIPIVDG
jgi:hypothetical protein